LHHAVELEHGCYAEPALFSPRPRIRAGNGRSPEIMRSAPSSRFACRVSAVFTRSAKNRPCQHSPRPISMRQRVPSAQLPANRAISIRHASRRVFVRVMVRLARGLCARRGRPSDHRGLRCAASTRRRRACPMPATIARRQQAGNDHVVRERAPA
jgi:hypothetical protein